MERKVIVKHIEQQVEDLLYRKNEILRRATNGVDYRLDEATRLMKEQWLQYTERVDSIEDQVVESFPILNSVKVNVNRTISKIKEIELRSSMWLNRWSDDAFDFSYLSNASSELDALLHTLEFYRDDPDGLNVKIARSRRMDLLLCLNPEERAALENNQLDRLPEPLRRMAKPLPPYGFLNIYRMMKELRYTCEHWDVLAANWEDNVELDFCQDVLTTLQSDLDTSLRRAKPELADVITAVRRKRDKMQRHISYNWADEFKQDIIDNTGIHVTVPAMKEIDDLMATVNRSRDIWQTMHMRQTSTPFISQTIIEGLSELYNRVDEFKQEYIIDNPPLAFPKAAVDYIFGKKSSPVILKTFCEMMGGFDSKAARAMRQSWMKILIENSTIGTEWDPEKIREVRRQFSREEYEARLGKDLAASLIGIFEDAIAISKQTDFLNPAGSRSWFSTWERN